MISGRSKGDGKFQLPAASDSTIWLGDLEKTFRGREPGADDLRVERWNADLASIMRLTVADGHGIGFVHEFLAIVVRERLGIDVQLDFRRQVTGQRNFRHTAGVRGGVDF